MTSLIKKIREENKRKFLDKCFCPICGAKDKDISYRWANRKIDNKNIKEIVFMCKNCGEEGEWVDNINDILICIQLYLKEKQNGKV
jgi:transcription elongation factor Elf1